VSWVHPRSWCYHHDVKQFTILALVLAAACSRAPEPRRYPLTGQVLDVKTDGTLLIRHDDIKGFMPGMTMPFRVKDTAEARGRVPGDLIRATLSVTDDESWLSGIQKTGWAPLKDDSSSTRPAVELLKPGEALPDETLIDQDGRAFRISSLKGTSVLITFVYTRCPLPEFCPRMDAHFAAVQKAIEDGRVKGPVRLLSISFDPDFDTPAVLKAHAARNGANPTVWTYATAPRDKVEAWGAKLGLSVIRDAANPSEVTHNLRTAVVDPQGRLVTVLEGNRWTPDEAIAALSLRR
jgi:protein SCO1